MVCVDLSTTVLHLLNHDFQDEIAEVHIFNVQAKCIGFDQFFEKGSCFPVCFDFHAVAVQPFGVDVEAALFDIRKRQLDFRGGYPDISALWAFYRCRGVLLREALPVLRYALEVKVDSTLLLSTEGNVLCFELEVFVANGAVMAFPAGRVDFAEV